MYVLSHIWLFEILLDCSPLDSSVHGMFQARIQEFVAISSSRGSSQPRDETASPVFPALQADSLPLSHQGSPNTYA